MTAAARILLLQNSYRCLRRKCLDSMELWLGILFGLLLAHAHPGLWGNLSDCMG